MDANKHLIRQGGYGRAGFDGLGIGAQNRHTRGDHRRHQGGDVPGSKRLQWSGVERSGAGRRIDLSGRDPKKHDQVVTLKYIKGQSLEFNIAAALGLELHHPIMS